MKRVGNSRGFTIVETVIFLAVSSGLFVSAMFMMSGQQAKTEFHQAVGETQSIIDDTTNDVATGFFLNPAQNTCSDWNGPFVWGGASAQRGNQLGCILLGRAVQFGDNINGQKALTIWNVVGLRKVSALGNNGPLVSSLVEAKASVYAADTTMFSGGLTIKYANYLDPATSAKVPIGGFAITSRLTDNSTGGLNAGSTTADLIPLPVPMNSATTTFRTDGVEATLRSASPVKNPPSGVAICLDSGGTAQHVILRIGANGSLSSTYSIKSGSSSADGECV